MTGTIKDYTPNFNFIIPEFNITGWHDYLEENFRSVDALLYNIFDIQNYSGKWQRLTSYTVGQVLFIDDAEDPSFSGKLYKVLVDHTTGDMTFDEYYEANPTYYERYLDASSAQQYANYCKIYAEGTDIEAASLGITHSCKKWNELAAEVVNSAQSYVNLSKDWATKTTGTVDGSDYSAKYYAQMVNSISTDIEGVYTIRNDVTSVANNASDISTTAYNISSVNTVASNISAIQNAQTYATNAANSATLSQNWAVSDSLVASTDYSAKYYAQKAKENATTAYKLGTLLQSFFPLTSADVHLCDGSLLSGVGVYKDFYDYMVNLYHQPSFPNCFVTEVSWQTAVSTNGFCAKFVIDEDNKTIRIPYLNNCYTKAVASGASDTVSPQLVVDFQQNTIPVAQSMVTGAIGYIAGVHEGADGHAINDKLAGEATLPVSSIDVASVEVLYYIVVATAIEDEIIVDINNYITDLNTKAATDLRNCTKPYVIDEVVYNHGDLWYRIWSDGWIEQGGFVYGTISSGGSLEPRSNITIYLPQTYNNTNYSVFLQNNKSGRGESSTVWDVYYKYLAEFGIETNYNIDNNIIYWYAQGKKQENSMEIKDILKKPYTENQRLEFIYNNNAVKGYLIKETDEALIAYYEEPTPLTNEEISKKREICYEKYIDPITAHIQRLRDEEQTEEILTKINELVEERSLKVEEIKQKYPYHEEIINNI